MTDPLLKKYYDEDGCDDDGNDFINEAEINRAIEDNRTHSKEEIRAIFEKARNLNRLTLDETAALLHLDDKELLDEMYRVAYEVKQKVYGNRIVFFAPLYISNECINNCAYCGFRCSNPEIERKTLTQNEIAEEVEILEDMGHKRLILVYGEHPKLDIDWVASTIKTTYDVHKGKGEIRRVNINAAPMPVEHLRRLKEAGIGTYQVFQETYHHETYHKVHPKNTLKGNYKWRVTALDRAQDAGVDDVAMGVLFGLYDWKFEVLAMMMHATHLEDKYNGVGPHTISFPRLEPAIGTPFNQNPEYQVSDEDFKKIVAVIRLSVPYTGMILTAREPAELRDEFLTLGITQIDAGSHIGLGGYKEFMDSRDSTKKEQFVLSDSRSLDEAMAQVFRSGQITSFCTAGYRCGRTGETIMKLLKCGGVKTYCMPNAILTTMEYLLDYASPETKKLGIEQVEKEIEKLPDGANKQMTEEYLERIKKGERDLYL